MKDNAVSILGGTATSIIAYVNTTFDQMWVELCVVALVAFVAGGMSYLGKKAFESLIVKFKRIKNARKSQ